MPPAPIMGHMDRTGTFRARRSSALLLALPALAAVGLLLAGCDRRPNPWEAAARAGGGKAVQQQAHSAQPTPATAPPAQHKKP